MKPAVTRLNTRRNESGCALAARLPALHDGELDAAAAAEVQAHLDGCEACRQEARALLRMRELLRHEPLPHVALPSGAQMATRILEQEAARAPEPEHWLRSAWRPGLALAAVALVAALIRTPTTEVPAPPPSQAPAVEASLPALVVMDDEQTGRQVLMAPAAE